MGQIRDRMEADLKLKGFALTTRKEYLLRARHCVAYFGRSPEELGESDVSRFLLHLVEEQGVRATTHRMYVAAIKFLFAVTLKRPEVVATIPLSQVPKKLPDVLSGEEVERLLNATRSPKHRALLMTAYSAGLRISEACTPHWLACSGAVVAKGFSGSHWFCLVGCLARMPMRKKPS